MRIAVIASSNRIVPAGLVLQKLDNHVASLHDVELVVIEKSTESLLVEGWASKKKLKVIRFPSPDWRRLGRAAGSICNTTIRDNSDYGIFFQFNESSDIKDLVKKFEDKGKKYLLFKDK